MNKTIYLVRHCQATGQEPEDPLTELGKQQAIGLAESLSREPICRIISSPFLRAYQTAQPVAQLCHLPLETDERLRERVLCGNLLDEWREALETSFTDLDVSLPGGESSREAMKRSMEAIADLSGPESGVTVVVTHGNLLTLLLKSFDDKVGFAEWQSLASPDIYRVKYVEGIVSVEHIKLISQLAQSK